MNKKVIFSIIGGCALLSLCACVSSTVFLLPKIKEQLKKSDNNLLTIDPKNLGSITQTPTIAANYSNPSYTTYTNSQYSFEVQYPKDWTKSEGEQGTLVLVRAPKDDSLDTFTENINVVVEDLKGKNIALDSYIDLSLNNVEKYIENVYVLEKNKTKLGNQDAYDIIYTGTSNGLDLQWKQTIALHNQTAYILTFTATEEDYSKYENTAEEIASTFKFK